MNTNENQGQPLISKRGKRAAKILGMSDIEGECFVNAADETMARVAPLPRPLEQEQWTVEKEGSVVKLLFGSPSNYATQHGIKGTDFFQSVCDAHNTSLRALQEELAVKTEALIRLRDCDWVITPRDRMDAVRDIARKALEKKEA